MKKIFSLVMILFVIIISASKVSAQNNQQQIENKIWSLVTVDSTYIPPSQPTIINYIQSRENRVLKLNDNVEAIISPNLRVLPTTNTTQSEVSIDVNPVNPNIMFGSANTTNWPVTTLYGSGTYFSNNGGNSWTGKDSTSFDLTMGDPAAAIGTNGNYYLGFITSGRGQGVACSTDNGISWTKSQPGANPPSSSDLLDKNHLMVDKLVGSPFENRIYEAYTNFVTHDINNDNVVFHFSSDNGQTWSPGQNLSSSDKAGFFNHGVNIQTGPNGEVYVIWAIYDDWSVGNYGEDDIGFIKSTDGGVSWGPAKRIYSHHNFGIRSTAMAPKYIRANSFPSMAVDKSNGPFRGEIYITFPAINTIPAGTDPDILVIKSSDGGTTWSSGIRVNDDPVNNGKDQYLSWCSVDQSTGALYVDFYDSRNSANNDSAEVFLAVSLDGAQTFTNLNVSEAKFKPHSISGLASGYQGDYIGITSVKGAAYPFWSDNRTGNYQAWISKVVFGPVILQKPLVNTENQNGPYKVGVKINSLDPLNPNKMFVYWTRGTAFTDSVPMISVTADSFYANIPGNGSAANYKYYIYVGDSLGGFNFSPATAPSSYYTFTASIDSIPPTIIYTVLPDQLRETWPAAITTNITDNIGVDSAWVVYKLRYNGNLKSFKLIPDNNSNYSGVFNIDTSSIAVGDTMYYRIDASDASMAHNLAYSPAATGFNSFKFVFNSSFPLILHTPIKTQPIKRWPVVVSVIAKDTLGINNVQCLFNINHGPIKSFTLSPQGNNNYSASFINTFQVNAGDSVFYQISATDNSNHHNISYAPSTGYYSFKVINTKGIILVVNDDISLADRFSSDKGSQGDAESPLGVSSNMFYTTLYNDGYLTDTTNFANLDTTALGYYNIIILSCGSKATIMFNDSLKRKALVKYVNNGGKTWVEGGEVGYTYKQSNDIDQAFRRTILNDSSWVSDAQDASLNPIQPYNQIFNYPDTLSIPIAFTGTGYGLKDAMTLLPKKPGVTKLAGWSSFPDTAGIICCYANGDPTNVINIFFTFAISAITDPIAAQNLIGNTAALLSGFISTTSVNNENILPKLFSLGQNYPNPFNPSTSIRYSIPKDGFVRMVIYNILGERVATLVNDNMKAGTYEVKFDASRFASGIYFYRLESGNSFSVKKMELLK